MEMALVETVLAAMTQGGMDREEMNLAEINRVAKDRK